MFLTTYKPLLNLLLLSAFAFAVHKLIFIGFNINTSNFHYSLEFLYPFYTFLSLVILTILLKVEEKNFDVVGLSFLLITSVKMIICYIVLRPILNDVNQNPIEKLNFLILFFIFLTFDALFSIILVNKKHK